jgi:hypothetical protein
MPTGGKALSPQLGQLRVTWEMPSYARSRNSEGRRILSAMQRSGPCRIGSVRYEVELQGSYNHTSAFLIENIL